MTDLADWLLEQLDDSNMPDLHLRTCQTLKPVPPGTPAIVGDRWTCDCGMVDWWIADAASKRRLVADCVAVLMVDGWEFDDAPDLARLTLRRLATPLAGRPGYLEEWKP